ncbi:methylated-DNA--[protein]-cysteine S-methyltransferase [Congregibacter brevis]|uniref:Methylated-DNA--[protein]-cysteine S-methyltransferase n=1 Tax=Congregibacter brevis TaxID=3081201 RepID=A0ABZ0IDW1_9GAMM|nr:methylated-DNA--[protein]-cysteine S-methyltransferase [Congregibacter sp. IMCC45268]
MLFHLFETNFGTCAIGWNDIGLARVQLPESTPAETEARMIAANMTSAPATLPSFAREARDALLAYFSGEAVAMEDLVLDYSLVSPFNALIYRALRGVPRGEIVSYGDLAKEIGQPGAARAVGIVMSKNPWPVVVPCHRVIGANGKLTGFSAYGGVDTKLSLLTLEGTQFGDTPGLFDDPFFSEE